MTITKRLGTAAAAAALALALLQPATAQDIEEDRVVAVVNGAEIRMLDVFEGIQELPPQYQQMPPQALFEAVVQQLINRQLMSEQGYAEGLEETDEVRDRMAYAERRFVQEAWIRHQMDEQVTEERLRAAYDGLLTEMGDEVEVHARHILVPSEEEARDAIERLDAGEDFAALAGELSQEPGAAERGGDLGYFTREMMVAPFAEAAFEIEPGTYGAEPVETRFGWHVIQVEDRRTAEPPPFEAVQGELEMDLRQEVVRDIIQALRADAQIVRYDLEGMEIPEDAQPQ